MNHKAKMEADVKVLVRLPKRLIRDLDVQVAKNPKYASRNHAIRLAVTAMLSGKGSSRQ